MTSTIRWIKKRIDKRLRLLFHEYLDDELEILLPLNLHYQRYAESTPADRQSEYDHTLDPQAHLLLFGSLKDRLENAGTPVGEMRIDLADFDAWRQSVPGLDQFYRSFGDMHIEKCLEHYLVDRLLDLKAGDRYLDIASAGSPWASALRQRQIEAYRLDLIYPDGVHGMEIGANATAMGLPDGFATALSSQCAFELFHGETDLRFLHEADRVLAPGGRLAVLPLYLDDVYFLLQSPYALPPPETAESEATVIWRDDHFREPYSRHYSPEAFAQTIYSRLPAGLDVRVYFVSNLEELMWRHPDQRIYCFYVLQATKKAAGALGDRGDTKAMDPLIVALKDSDQYVRLVATRALGKFGASALQPLIVALEDSDPTVRLAAVRALGELGAPAVEPLIVALKDSDPTVRLAAVRALGKLGAPAVEPLIVALKDSDSGVRHSAVWLLGKLGAPAVEPLIVALKDSDSGMRHSAVQVLGKLGAPAVEPLIVALKDSDPTVRSAAARALGKLGDACAVEPLEAVLHGDSQRYVREVAEEALNRLR